MKTCFRENGTVQLRILQYFRAVTKNCKDYETFQLKRIPLKAVPHPFSPSYSFFSAPSFSSFGSMFYLKVKNDFFFKSDMKLLAPVR